MPYRDTPNPPLPEATTFADELEALVAELEADAPVLSITRRTARFRAMFLSRRFGSVKRSLVVKAHGALETFRQRAIEQTRSESRHYALAGMIAALGAASPATITGIWGWLLGAALLVTAGSVFRLGEDSRAIEFAVTEAGALADMLLNRTMEIPLVEDTVATSDIQPTASPLELMIKTAQGAHRLMESVQPRPPANAVRVNVESPSKGGEAMMEGSSDEPAAERKGRSK